MEMFGGQSKSAADGHLHCVVVEIAYLAPYNLLLLNGKIVFVEHNHIPHPEVGYIVIFRGHKTNHVEIRGINFQRTQQSISLPFLLCPHLP